MKINNYTFVCRYSPHCFPYISYLGTDEENLYNIKDLFFLSDNVLLFLEPLCLINLSDVLTL